MTKPIVRGHSLVVQSADGLYVLHTLRQSKFTDPIVTAFAPMQYPTVVAAYFSPSLDKPLMLLSAQETCKRFSISKQMHCHHLKMARTGTTTLIDFTLMLTNAVHAGLAPFVLSDSLRFITVVRPIHHTQGDTDDQTSNQGG